MADTTSQLAPGRLMSYAELADVCGVSVRSILRAVSRGELVVHRIGRAARVSVEDARAWIASKRDLRHLYRDRPSR